MVYEWFRNIDFAWPENFLLLGLLPLLIWHYLRTQYKARGAVLVTTTNTLQVTTAKTKLRHTVFILRLLAITSIIVALARPQERSDIQKTQGEGIDIMLCIDVSGSMGERDIPPSRMEAAKQVAEDFVRNRPVDRIGLVIFSGESFTKCPITPDKNTLIKQIRSLDLRDGGYLEQGTLIGEGLATAVDRISSSNAKSQIVILLTDGKEDAPVTRLIDPLAALEIAKVKGVKVYTIGMGAGAASTSELSGETNKATDDFLDEGLLNKIAVETGGLFFRATNKKALTDIYASIDKLEKSKVELVTYKRFKEQYIPFLLAALAFLLLEQLLRMTVFRRLP
ncbi:VWA domain-containing protein [Terrimonas rubra]|uniref:VWA domain-containing protein n=1 Tax=Terrimonas rubra TaxID=1035890 RepID=A0ABW6A076_9BACT